MQIERIAPRFTVKIEDIEAAIREGLKVWQDGSRVLFSHWKPRGNWQQMCIPVKTNEPEAA